MAACTARAAGGSGILLLLVLGACCRRRCSAGCRAAAHAAVAAAFGCVQSPCWLMLMLSCSLGALLTARSLSALQICSSASLCCDVRSWRWGASRWEGMSCRVVVRGGCGCCCPSVQACCVPDTSCCSGTDILLSCWLRSAEGVTVLCSAMPGS
jgi:hypothetical protein